MYSTMYSREGTCRRHLLRVQVHAQALMSTELWLEEDPIEVLQPTRVADEQQVMRPVASVSPSVQRDDLLPDQVEDRGRPLSGLRVTLSGGHLAHGLHLKGEAPRFEPHLMDRQMAGCARGPFWRRVAAVERDTPPVNNLILVPKAVDWAVPWLERTGGLFAGHVNETNAEGHCGDEGEGIVVVDVDVVGDVNDVVKDVGVDGNGREMKGEKYVFDFLNN